MNRFIQNSYVLNSSLNGTSASSTGLKIFRTIDLNSNWQLVFNAPPGGIYGWNITNTDVATVYIKFYNTTSPPVIGIDVPEFVITVTGNTLNEMSFASPIDFSNGCYVLATTGIANDNTDDPSPNQVVVDIYYTGNQQLDVLLLEDGTFYFLENNSFILLE